MDIKRYLHEKKGVVDQALELFFPDRTEGSMMSDIPLTLHGAIRYSLIDGGKRIRPILSIAAFEAVGGRGDKILPFACALEMIHTYSLIHDDLPAIDNDDYRRGKPTCHKVFGEAMGILAGDGLLTEAFGLMTNHSKDAPEVILDIVNEVARASGIEGMVGGQVVDIESEGKEVSIPTLQYIHTHKTGALITVSLRTGAKLGGGDEKTVMLLTQYGEKIGLAFQIVDDILNVEGDAETLGKKTGSDRFKRKVTYPALWGLEESKRESVRLMEAAIEDLRPLGKDAGPLREIAKFIVLRDY